MEVHEFWLKAHRGIYGQDPNKTLPIYRVALGQLIDATQRKTFSPYPGSNDHNLWNKSGSIGFMDLTRRVLEVPNEGAHPLSNPSRSRYLEYLYSWRDLEKRDALIIEMIGIEPKYRRQGYARFLKRRVEEIALEWGLDTVVSILIQNVKMRKFNIELGYRLFDNGVRAVKRLK